MKRLGGYMRDDQRRAMFANMAKNGGASGHMRKPRFSNMAVRRGLFDNLPLYNPEETSNDEKELYEIEALLTDTTPKDHETKIKNWKRILEHFEYDKDLIIKKLVLNWYHHMFGDEASYYIQYRAYESLSVEELIDILLEREDDLTEEFKEEVFLEFQERNHEKTFGRLNP